MSKRRKRRQRGKRREKSFQDRSVGVSSGTEVVSEVPAPSQVINTVGKEFIEFVAPKRPTVPTVPRTQPKPPSVKKPSRGARDYVMPDARKPGANTNPLVPDAPRVGDTVGDDPYTQEIIRRANQGKKRSSVDVSEAGIGGGLAFVVPVRPLPPLPRLPIPLPGPAPAPVPKLPPFPFDPFRDKPPRDKPKPLDKPPVDKPPVKDKPPFDRPPLGPEQPQGPVDTRPKVPGLPPVPTIEPNPREKKVPPPPPLKGREDDEDPDPKPVEVQTPGGRSYWRRSERMFTIGKPDRY